MIEHRDYKPLKVEQKIETVGEMTTYQFIRSDQILNLEDSYLAPADA